MQLLFYDLPYSFHGVSLNSSESEHTTISQGGTQTIDFQEGHLVFLGVSLGFLDLTMILLKQQSNNLIIY